jgi:rare lipoprotein A
VRYGGFVILLGLSLWGVLSSCSGPSAELREGRDGTVEEGFATYYSPRLAGHATASGEPYDPAALTAAHPVLPFGTRVRVVRLNDPRPAVVVRINDRCAGRKKIIDLSEAAARRLGMLRAGIVQVRIEVISGAEN